MEEPTLFLDEALYAAAKNYAKTVLGSEEPTTEFSILMESFVNGARWWVFECECSEEDDD